MGLLRLLGQGIRTLREFAEEATAPLTEQEFGVSEESDYKRNEVDQYTPDALVSKKKFDIYETMYWDDQINMCLTALKLIRLSSGFEIEPASEDVADQEVADFVADALNDVRDPCNKRRTPIHSVVYNTMGALEMGWSLQETVLRIIEEGRWTGKVGYKAIKSKNPKYFNVSVDDFDAILEIVSISGRTYGRKYPAEKFLVYSFMKRYENVFGTSRLRSLYQWWWVKQIMIRAMGVYMEKFGIPMPIGHYPRRFTTTKQNALLDALKQMRFEHALILPDGATVDFKEVSGKGAAGFLEIINKADAQIAKTIMGQTLTSEAGGQDGAGSFSLGKVQFTILELYLNFLGRDVSENPMQTLIERLVDYNFSGVVKYPRWKFKPLSSENLAEHVGRFNSSVAAGTVIATEADEERIREILKFPTTASQQLKVSKSPNKIKVLTPKPAEPVDPTSFPTASYRPPTPSGPGAPPNTPVFAESTKIFTGVSRRKVTAYEGKVDFQEALEVIEVDGTKTIATKMSLILKGSVDKLFAEVKRKKIMELQDWNAIGKLELRGRGELNAAIIEGMQDVAKSGSKAAKREIRAAKKFVDIQLLTPDEVLKFLKRKSFEMSDATRNDVLKKVKQQLMQGVKSGKSFKETVSAIEDALEPYFKRGTLDEDKITPGRLETIVRTNVSEAYNEAKKAIYTDPDLEGFVESLQYSAILDDRVRSNHEAMDGVIRPVTDPIWEAWTPPNGYNCRCTIVPVTQFEEYENTKKIPKVEPDKGFA